MRTGLSVFVFGLAAIFVAMPAMPGRIPGDRLVANLTERLKKEPKNASVYYLIGRVHYATFSRSVEWSRAKDGEVEVYQQNDTGYLSDDDSQIGRLKDLPFFYSVPGNIYPWDSKTAIADSTANRRHVSEAIKNLRIALDLMAKNPKSSTEPEWPAPSRGLAHLTLACTFDSAAGLASHIKLDKPYDSLNSKKQWRDMAASEYLSAFHTSIGPEEKCEEAPTHGLQMLVSYEAGNSYLRIKPNAPERKEILAGIDKLKHLPPGPITPLIFDMTESKPLADLLEPTRKVSFDLDGTGRPQTYGWVKPTTAFLVWDPAHEGKITSGRQLFGNATWWMLWSNAYAALDALDDNRDGWLSGKELHGLALWFDRNGNGKCDPGEVIPIEQTPIVAIRTKFDCKSGQSLVSSVGLVLKDGRTLPTYDWVTRSQ